MIPVYEPSVSGSTSSLRIPTDRNFGAGLGGGRIHLDEPTAGDVEENGNRGELSTTAESEEEKMKASIWWAGVSLITLAGCSDPQAASESNFMRALQEHYDDAGLPCYVVREEFPHSVTTTETAEGRELEGQFLYEQTSTALNPLIELGFIEVSSRTETRENQFGRVEMDTEHIFALTSEGEAVVRPLVDATDDARLRRRDMFGSGRVLPTGTAFCYGAGGYRVVEVTNWTVPTGNAGVTMSTVEFTLTAGDLADWAVGSEALQEQSSIVARDVRSVENPRETRKTMLLTAQGWVTE